MVEMKHTDASPEQIRLLRDIRMKGAIECLLFSKWRSFGPSLREAGLIDGVGDGTSISALGFAALAQADTALSRAKGGSDV